MTVLMSLSMFWFFFPPVLTTYHSPTLHITFRSTPYLASSLLNLWTWTTSIIGSGLEIPNVILASLSWILCGLHFLSRELFGPL